MRALREAQDLSVDQFAATLGVGAGEVRGWEAGTLRVPAYEGAWMRYMQAQLDRGRAQREAGVEDCPWMLARGDEIHAALEKQDLDGARRLQEEADRHAAGCADCLAVRAWADTQPPLPSPPAPGGLLRALLTFFKWSEGLPAWIRPAVYGAAVFGGVTFLRLLIVLLVRGPSVDAATDVLLGLLAGGAMGAAGGLTWAAVHRPLRRLGRAAPYVAGMVAAAGGGLVITLLLPLLGEDGISLADSSGWAMVAFSAVFGGLMLGRLWLRKLDDSAG